MKQAILLLLAWASWSAAPAFGQTCSGEQTFTFSAGTINDGSASGNYSDGLNCGFLIQTPGAASYTLTFTEFALQNGPDKLIVYRGASPAAEVHAVLTGSTIPAPLTVDASAVYLRFVTDGSVNDAGWTLNYAVDSPPPGPSCAGTTLVFAPNGTINDGSGIGNYSSNLDCRWILSPSGAKTLTLTFTEFDLQLVNDVVEIYSGDVENPANLVAAYSGSALPPSVSVQGNPAKMLVVFRTDAAVEAAGFTFDYFSSSGFCAGPSLLTDVSGTVTDGSGPANYANNANCSWRIQPQYPPDRIRITFTEFNTQAGADFVRVYAGADATATLLGTFSGTSVPAPIVVENPAAFVLFTSNSTTRRPGWSFDYNLEYNLCSPPSNLQVSVSGDAALLTWTPHGGAAAPYLLEVTGQGGYGFSIYLPVGTSEYTIFNLPAGRDYTATLTALCAGDSPLTVDFETECPAPSLPVVDVFTQTDDYVAIYWNTHPDVPNYAYELYAQSVLVQNGTVAQGFVDFANLDAGTDYVFRLYNQCYNGPSSTYLETTFSTPCLAPDGVSAFATETEATFSWNAVQGVNEYGVSLSDGDEFSQTFTVFSPEAVWAGLVPGANYIFEVRSVCVNGSESPMAGLTFSTVCPQVVNAQVASVGINSADLNWETLFGQNEVRVRLTDAESQTVFDGMTSDGFLTLTGLAASTTFTVEIATLCRDVDSEPVFLSFTTATCEGPVDLEVVDVTGNDATIAWSVVNFADRYTYTLTDDAAVVASATTVSTSTTLENLTPGVEYVFSVYATCESENSPVSELVFALDCPVPINLNASAQDYDAEVSWNAASGADAYQFSLFRFDNPDPVLDISVSETSVYLSELEPGTRYLVRVATVCEDAGSDFVEIEFYTNCPAPENGEVVAGVYDAAAAWTLVAGVDVFVLYLNGEYYETISGTSYVLSGLEPGTNYSLQVASACNDSESGALDLSFQTVCPQVEDVALAEIATDYIVFEIAPMPGVPGYRIAASAMTDGVNAVQDFAVSPDNLYTLSGLSSGEDYYVEIYTLCNDSESDPVGGDVSTQCITQTGLEVGEATATTAVAVWDHISDYGYWVTFGSETNIVYAPELYLEGLLPGNVYELSVAPVCMNGTYGTPMTVTFNTICPTVENLAVSNLTSSSALLTWDEVPGAEYFVVLYDWNGMPVGDVNVVYEPSFEYTDLTAGGSYEAYVYTYCPGTGETTLDPAVVVFDLICPQIDYAEQVGASEYEVEVTFPESAAAVQYILRLYLNGEPYATLLTPYIPPFVIDELVPGENYVLEISAICPLAVESASYVMTVSTQCPDMSAAPEVFAGVDTARVEWTAVEGINAYDVEIYDAMFELVAQTLATGVSHYTFTGLTAGKSYYALVTASCTNGSGGGLPVPFMTLCPVPENLSVDAGVSSVVLSWNDFGAEYEILLFDGTQTFFFVADASPFTLTGLNPETMYTVAVRALCAEIESEFGDPVEFSTFACPVPENVVVANVGAVVADLEWTSSTLANGGYVVVVENDVMGASTFFSMDSPYSMTGLAPGAYYTGTIVAICDDVVSGSASFSFSTLCLPAENLAALDITENSALLTWDEVPNDNGYFVEYYPQSDPSASMSEISFVNQLSIYDLAPGTTYVVVVKTTCVDFESEERTLTFTTVCPAPEVVLSAGESFIVMEVANVVGSAFDVKIETDDATIVEQTVVVEPSGEYVFDGLAGGTNYIVTVTNTCADALGSFVGNVATVCGYPDGGEVVATTATTATISWNAVDGVATYGLAVYSTAGSILADGLVAEDSPFTFTGLTPGTTYEVELYTECPNGIGDFQIIDVFTTPCPGPTDLTFVQSTATTAELSWTGAEGVVDYRLTLQPGDLEFVVSGTSVVLTDLVAGTLFTASVVSICNEFDSEASNFVEFATLCPDVASVEVSEITATTATISWPASEGAASYNVSLYNMDDGTSQDFLELTETSLSPTDLEPNTGYTVYVFANCLGGESSFNPATTVFQTSCAVFELAAVASDDTPCLVSFTELSVEESLIDAGFNPEEFNVTWQPEDLTGTIVTVNPQTTTTYTAVAVRNGCEYVATVTLVLPTIASVSADAVCIVEGGSASIEVFNAVSFRVEPENDVVIDANVVTFSNDESETYIVVVTDENACEQYFVVNAWVNVPADFNLTDGQHFYTCAAPVDLTGTPGGGTFSTLPDGLLSGTTLDPSVVEPGEYVVTYAYTGAGGCVVGRSVTITVGGSPSAEIVPVDGDNVLCSYQTGPFELSAVPAGGVFSGTGVAGEFFTPVDGPGVYAVYYEVETGGCTFTSSISITYLDGLGASVETTNSTGGADGTITVTAYGGLSPYEYSLNDVDFQLEGYFEGLNDGDYTVYIRDAAGCETTVSATVGVCSVPVFASAVPNANSAVVNWTNLVPSTPYSLRYRPVGNPTFQIRTNINTTSVNLTGLLSATTYEGQIISACGAESEFFTFTTLSGGGCTLPTGLSAGYIASTTALATWNTVDAATSYILRWRPVGGTFYTQTIVTAPATSHLITGLVAGTTYEISVRSRCGTLATVFSAPVSYLHTLPSRLTQFAASSEILLYPNPSQGDFAVRFVSEIEQSAEITVVDLSGRAVYRKTMVAREGENQFSDTVQVARGVYVVSLRLGATVRNVKWVVE